jgi:hypothetical protein
MFGGLALSHIWGQTRDFPEIQRFSESEMPSALLGAKVPSDLLAAKIPILFILGAYLLGVGRSLPRTAGSPPRRDRRSPCISC